MADAGNAALLVGGIGSWWQVLDGSCVKTSDCTGGLKMSLYWKYFSIHLKSQMQYKVSFFLTALGQFLGSFTAFLGNLCMFSQFR